MVKPSQKSRPKHTEKSPTKNRGKSGPRELHPAGRRSDDGRAFLLDPYDGGGAPARTAEPFAETLAEEYVVSATTAEEMTEDDRNQLQTEEMGGPFSETTGAEEFATEPDESNPIDAVREPFPTANRPPS